MVKQFRSNQYYPWIIVAAGLILSGAGSGIFISTLGVFVKPVCDALGFQRSSFLLYSTIFFISNVVLLPVYGNLIRRFGSKKIALISSVMCGAALLGYSCSTELMHFYLCALLSGLFINGISSMAVGVLINNWFQDSRGTASGIAFSGSTIAAAILIPVMNHVITVIGWRSAFRVLMIIELVLTVPLILLVIYDTPEQMGLQKYTNHKEKVNKVTESQNIHVPFEKALRTPVFGLLFLTVVAIAFVQAGANSNTVSILSDIGYADSYAARISSVYMILITLCKVGMGAVFDKLGRVKASMMIGFCCMLFPISALFLEIPVVPWVYIVLLAVAGSGSTVLGAVLTGEYFGSKDYSRIYSVIALGTQLGAAFSTPFLGLIYDLNGVYTIAWIILAVVGALVVGMLFAADHLAKRMQEQSLLQEAD